MHIDLRQPVLVISGYWNPRIFGVDWIAQNIFEIASGSAVEVGQVFVPDRPPITFINTIGIQCSNDRFEIYASTPGEDALVGVEKIALRTLSLLSHTPVFGFGANFTFADINVDAQLADALMTAERLEAKLSERMNTVGTRSRGHYVLGLVEADCAAEELERVLADR